MPQASPPSPDGGAVSTLSDQAASHAVAVDPATPAFEAAHKAMLDHHKIQFDFPTYAMKPPKPLPEWLKVVGELLKPIGWAMPYIFWGCVALAVLFILYLIVRELGGFRWARKGRTKPVDLEYRPDADVAKAVLGDADELAAQGRFAEAVHVLLLRSIDDMRLRRPRALKPSLTSRDISILPALPEAARPAFAAMARAVERSLFGGRPVDRAEFEACRQSYADFAFPQAWT